MTSTMGSGSGAGGRPTGCRSSARWKYRSVLVANHLLRTNRYEIPPTVLPGEEDLIAEDKDYRKRVGRRGAAAIWDVGQMATAGGIPHGKNAITGVAPAVLEDLPLGGDSKFGSVDYDVRRHIPWMELGAMLAGTTQGIASAVASLEYYKTNFPKSPRHTDYGEQMPLHQFYRVALLAQLSYAEFSDADYGVNPHVPGDWSWAPDKFLRRKPTDSANGYIGASMEGPDDPRIEILDRLQGNFWRIAMLREIEWIRSHGRVCVQRDGHVARSPVHRRARGLAHRAQPRGARPMALADGRSPERAGGQLRSGSLKKKEHDAEPTGGWGPGSRYARPREAIRRPCSAIDPGPQSLGSGAGLLGYVRVRPPRCSHPLRVHHRAADLGRARRFDRTDIRLPAQRRLRRPPARYRGRRRAGYPGGLRRRDRFAVGVGVVDDVEQYLPDAGDLVDRHEPRRALHRQPRVRGRAERRARAAPVAVAHLVDRSPPGHVDRRQLGRGLGLGGRG